MKPSKIAGQAAGKAKSMGKAMKGYSGIFRQLAEEHGEVSTLIQRVRVADETSPARRELFPEIRKELLSHARAEEQEFYGPLRRRTEMQKIVQHSITEHEEVERLLEDLQSTDMATPDWTKLFHRIADAVQEHVKEEEQELFPQARDVMEDGEAERMKESYLKAKEREKARIV